MIENWMVTLAITVVSLAFGYGLFRGRLLAIEQSFAAYSDEDKAFHLSTAQKMDAQFKRIDSTADRCTKLETQFMHLLSIREAEEKFVAKTELALHMKNIDSELAHLTKTNDAMLGKLDDLSENFLQYLRGENNAAE